MPVSNKEGGSYREAGATGRNDHRPIKDGDLQEKHATGQSGDDKEEEEKSGEHSVADTSNNQKSKDRSQAVAEGLHRLFEEHPEYLKRRPGQIACRLHMGRYTLFVPTDEEVEAVIEEMP